MKVPVIRGHWLWGCAREFSRDLLGTILDASRTHEDAVRFRVPFHSLYYLNRPEYARRIFTSNYARGPAMGSRKLARFVGRCLLTIDGEEWKKERKELQPSYSPSRLCEGRLGAMISEMLDRWSGEVDVHAESVRLVLRMAIATLFDYDLSETEAAEIQGALNEGQESIHWRMTHVPDLPMWIPTRANRRDRAALRCLDHYARKVGGERNRVVMNFLAAPDTTGSTLAWAMHLLATHPEEWARAESRPDRLALVARETLRLYPAAWVIDRVALAPDLIGPYEIPRGAWILVSPFALHRDPRYWANPERFDPDRFLAGEPAAYFPFGAGVHRCIGSHLVARILPLVLGEVLRRFRLRPLSAPGPEVRFTLRPKGGMRMLIESAKDVVRVRTARDDSRFS